MTRRRRERATRLAAVILAAGGGSRFAESPEARGHKLLASWRGRPLVTWAVDTRRRGRTSARCGW